MVYSENSVWFHLFTAYERTIVTSEFAGLDVREAFPRDSDGRECPVARCYTPEAFAAICAEAGLKAEYVGCYLSQQELSPMTSPWATAIADGRLAEMHPSLLRSPTLEHLGRPRYAADHAGTGRVYWPSDASDFDSTNP